ncbi:MAG: N-acetyl-gamma-glutamyl-phosphate reductase [Christensenellaceae bacterium]|jgi:N-acetyl-gamma-glutamyl-phosphate reductase|nr:N-acetyl-gamma-glutamyl-phosphate reductase [Christensenellaceae bacterium]
MAIKVFIDGQDGTTGLQLKDRLQSRPDLQLLEIAPELRKDVSARKALLNEVKIAFLCLPDAAAAEAAALVENDQTVLIDASTAHRVSENWAYGFPELNPAQREKIADSRRIANPGCYATGMIAIAAPLVAAGILPKDYPLCVHAVSGYSGAGKKGIAQYEEEGRDASLKSPREYGLNQAHKHLPEMTKFAGLTLEPIFNPYVCDYYAGMTVSLPLHLGLLKAGTTQRSVFETLSAHYEGSRFIDVKTAPEDGFLPATEHLGTNRLSIYVCGREKRLTVISSLDNLGKGASGAAVQNMNIALGLDEGAYL